MGKFKTQVHLSREMSLMDATMIGVGAMIGAGIFVLIGIAAGVAGPALLLAFFLNGIVTVFTAMAYAELGSSFHDAGGGYLWVKEGLPRWNGFLSGWMSWFAHAVACSLYALGFGAYFEHVIRELGYSVPHWAGLSPEKILAVLVAMLFAYVNFRGASETGKVGNFVTITKIVILIVFIGFGLDAMLRRPDWLDSFSPFMPQGWGGVFSAMGLTFIAFEGYEVISQCSEEVKNPKKNIPRAVFLSLIIVVPIYLLVAFVALGAVTPENMTSWDYLALHKEIALVEVARHFFIGGGIMIIVGGLISTMSALNATVYSSSRVAFAMARDRNFPTFLSKIHSKLHTPHWAIMFSTAIIVTMAVSLPIEDVAAAADIMFLLLFLQVNIALIPLRKKRPDLDRGYVVPWVPVIPIIGVLTKLFLAVYMFDYSPVAWITTAVWIGAGLLVYESYASKREVKYIQHVKALGELERKEYRILVAVSNPSTAESLSHLAMAIAKKNNAEMIFLHVIEVREGQSLRAGLDDQQEAMDFLEKATSHVEKSGLRYRSILKVSHKISDGIVDTAEEESCNFIILGRQKDPTFLERFFSSVIDSVVQESPCEVAVLHGKFNPKKIKNIVVPYGTDIHTRLAMEIAPAFIHHFKAKARIGVVFEPGTPLEDQNKRLMEIEKIKTDANLEAEVKVVRNKGVLQGVIQMTRHADMMVMAGRSGDFIELLLRRSISQEITEESDCPVLWVREYHEKESFWKSLFKSTLKEVKEVEEIHG